MDCIKHKTFEICDHCKEELDDYNQRIGSAYHTDCWKIVIDTERHEAIMKYGMFEIGQDIRVPIYDENGRRYKDYDV